MKKVHFLCILYTVFRKREACFNIRKFYVFKKVGFHIHVNGIIKFGVGKIFRQAVKIVIRNGENVYRRYYVDLTENIDLLNQIYSSNEFSRKDLPSGCQDCNTYFRY